MIEARALLAFAAEIWQMQLAAGRRFLNEPPAAETRWREPGIERLRRDPRVGEVVGDQRRYRRL